MGSLRMQLPIAKISEYEFTIPCVMTHDYDSP